MKYVYLFSEGNKDMKDLLGGKGANLAEMTNLGLPVPKGFTITTEACNNYYDNNEVITDELTSEIFSYVQKLEELTNKKFNDPSNPLLVSVRSGARASMPGMMDSIHFIGMNDVVADGFAKATNNPRFVYDTYRRLIQTYSDIAEDFDDIKFEELFEVLKKEFNVINDTDLTTEQLIRIIKTYKEEYKKRKGIEFPQDYKTQLINAVKGVFKSWNGERAKVYRKLNDIPDSWGTAVNVQENVFGNMNDQSGTGVAFTRNPATGEKVLFGEYLINAQGDDVVAGVRTPRPINELQNVLNDAYQEFVRISNILENHYKDMQDMEFTIENGKLYILQTRNGKRTAKASVKVACDLVKEGLITEEEALLRIDPNSLDQLLHPVFNEDNLKEAILIGKGLPASPGSATGMVVFSAKNAKEWNKNNKKVVLVRDETTPEDIDGMVSSEGVLTVRGGMTSHAAVVARGMGKCCVSGCSEIDIDPNNKVFKLGGYEFHEGDYISIDGTTGNIYKGEIKVVDPIIDDNFKEILSWSNKYRTLGVRTNADTPKDVKKALSLGAEGVGLCRTEHMFFEPTRILKMRKMILSETTEDRINSLNELLEFQKNDFKEMFKALNGLPMTVRYLDPPLHEFLPKNDEEINILANEMNIEVSILKEKIEEKKEVNPMMGHRGCRLDITYPEIAKMQTRAIIEAAIEASKEINKNIEPEIMIPLINDLKELKYIKDIIVEEAEKVKKEYNSNLKYIIGTMIEVPRAAILAHELALDADFFSFGTNDLTQMTYGFSRDDASKFLKSYYEKGIYMDDPFVKLDQNGVGKLVRLGTNLGRKVKPNLKIGVCGEHAANPESIKFIYESGINYVSCSPYRIPAAIVSSAIATIKNKD